eukprot:TRINITY_DN1106_c0_g1_i4.p1 TRINITY_DN1106_c0_g1~~TRINITY_DN1106_c0_g1_i4.p1  ORF type:complete len:619 (-),score=220.95 TRINITY_DN1106_c0_g1_i4:799-2655(-)
MSSCYRRICVNYSSSLIPSSKCRRSTLSDSSSSSGISDDLSSDSGSKSKGIVGSGGILSETSDYQRSTPSPRDEGLYLEDVSFQVHDEFVDGSLQKSDLGFEDYPLSWLESTTDRKTIYLDNQKLKVLPDFVYDPKIMFQRPEVLLSPIKKEKPQIKEEEEEDQENLTTYNSIHRETQRHHRKKRKKRKRSGEFLPYAAATSKGLIKPARLQVDAKEDIPASSKFSSIPSTGEANNPFLPIDDDDKKSFLFGSEEGIYPGSLDDIEEEVFRGDPLNEFQLRVPDEIAPSSSDEERLFQSSIRELQARIGVRTEEEEEEEEEEVPKSKCEEDLDEASGQIQTHKIRFPSNNLHKGTIDCKWEDCNHSFISHGKLSDHLRLYHVESQFSGSTFSCLWEGCKVYGKRSCSQSWLEKHVPIHGGKYAYSCIVSGCKMRFSSEKLLQRHVNHHFNARESSSDSTVAKKLMSDNPSESSRNLKRAGVKLKYRRTVFSARIFDVFDAGVMAGIKSAVVRLERGKRALSVEEDWEDEGGEDVIKFKIASVKGFRRVVKEGASVREALVKWSPENILEDEWIEASGLKDLEKVVRLRELPLESRDALGTELLGSKPPQSRRKRRTSS